MESAQTRQHLTKKPALRSGRWKRPICTGAPLLKMGLSWPYLCKRHSGLKIERSTLSQALVHLFHGADDSWPSRSRVADSQEGGQGFLLLAFVPFWTHIRPDNWVTSFKQRLSCIAAVPDMSKNSKQINEFANNIIGVRSQWWSCWSCSLLQLLFELPNEGKLKIIRQRIREC